MITTFQALARCAVTKTWAVGMCDNFCANMYGFDASGYVDATAHWAAMKPGQKHPADHNPPAGMLAFWGGGHGHIAISAGGGYVWSTDIAGAGTVAKVLLSKITTTWGKPYLGWSLPVFQGVEWSAVRIPGLDISDYQAASGWEKAIDFVIIKITEGMGYINPKWKAQRATAKSARLVRGFYHFARPGNMQAQADFFLSQITLEPGDFLALDWEDPGVTSAQKDAWLNYVKAKRPGVKVILYCNRDYWVNRDQSSYAGDGLWIADPNNPAGQPDIKAPWLIHQYSEAGGLDHDTAQFASRAAMAAWAGATTQGDEDVQFDDKYTNPKGVWSPDGPETATMGQWLAMGNKKAEVAAEAARAAASQSAANGTTLTTIATTLKNITSTGLTADQIQAIAAAVAPAVAALLPKPATAADIAAELSKRLQS